MTIKNVLVHVDSNETSAETVRTAASVARRFDARLNGFFVLPDVSVAVAGPAGGPMSPRIIEELQKDAEKHAATAERLFRDTVGDLVPVGEWTCAEGLGVGARAAAASAAFYADLIVMRQPADDTDDERQTSGAMPQDVVVDSGRPLLLLPPGTPAEMTANSVMVAWSESREAARAAFDSLPFLKAASRVSVVTVVKGDSDTPAPTEKVAACLGEHGIRAGVDMVPGDVGPGTAEVLFDHARKAGADLLVAGAYSHSRLREGLIGGVTNSIFDAAPMPVLLSH